MRTTDTALHAGDLRHTVQLIKPDASQTSDGMGGINDTADTVVLATLPAQILPASQERIFEAEGLRGTVDQAVTIRWSTEIQALNILKEGLLVKWVLESGDRLFQVVAVRVLAERLAVVKLGCREVPYDGIGAM